MSKYAPITFTDGTTGQPLDNWHPDVVARIIGYEAHSGLMVASDPDGGSLTYTLSPCCGASFKGCEGYVGCRACYADLTGLGGGVPFGEVVPVQPSVAWVVDEWVPYDSGGSIGVFTTREAAIAAVEAEGWVLDGEGFGPRGEGLRFISPGSGDLRWFISPLPLNALIPDAAS